MPRKEKIDRTGYWYIFMPNHPLAGKQGYIAEHRLIMEKHLKRFLKPQEAIHHINGNRKDNTLQNLILCSTHGEHTKKYHPEVLENMKQKCIGKEPWNKGRTGVYSKETLEKMRKSLKGRKPWNKGKPWSDEIKQKLSNTGKGRHYSPKSEFKKGMIPWNKGKLWNTETREKMRISALKRKQIL